MAGPTKQGIEDLIDLENRKGKRAGAYCTSFPDEGRVAILCNSTGEEDTSELDDLMDAAGYSGNTPENWYRTIRSTFIHETKHVASMAARSCASAVACSVMSTDTPRSALRG